MCICHRYIDVYPDGQKGYDEEWIDCERGPLGRPWECRYYHGQLDVEHVRRVEWSSRSSDTSSRRAPSIAPSFETSLPMRQRRPSSSRREPRPFAPLAMNALFGERRGTCHRSRRSESRTRTVVIEDRVPRVYPPATPSPTFRSSYESTTRYSESPMSPHWPMTPGYAGSFEADIVDASPYNRGRPIIHNENRRPRRNESTEVHPGPSSVRTPSLARPDVRDVRAREERRAQEEARRQRRAELEAHAAQLEHDIDKERRRQERRRQEELENAEINARLPRAPPVVRQPGILRRGSTARPERDSVIEELRDAERGEQVLWQAIENRERREREARQAIADNERRRLARRSHRSERVVYRDDDLYRR